MPKEVTHFLIAEKIMETLEKDSFWQPFLQHKSTIMLGSVFQDSLYYLPEKEMTDEIRNLPDRFHGDHGEDTFYVIKGLQVISHEQEQVVAFVIGMASHLFADAVFHPFVYYFSGNYFDRDEARRSEAIRNHRKIEGLMDVYFCNGFTGIRPYSVAGFLQSTGTDNLELFKCITEGVEMKDKSIELGAVVHAAFERFARVQRFFNNPLLRTVFPFVEPVVSDHSKELLALFYSVRSKKYIQKLAGDIHFQNPLTGEEFHTSMNNMFNEAVSQTVAFCGEFKDILEGNKRLADLPYGPSLELGIPNCRVDDMKYFSPRVPGTF
jgi:hypothetical protein